MDGERIVNNQPEGEKQPFLPFFLHGEDEMENEGKQLANRVEVNGDALRQLTRAVDNLTDAVRELSWLLLEGWKWKPVEEKEAQPASIPGIEKR